MCCCCVAVDCWLDVSVVGRRAGLLAGLVVGLFSRSAMRLEARAKYGLVLPWVGLGRLVWPDGLVSAG